MRCRSGDGCARAALEDKRFCEPHQKQLDKIRAELSKDKTKYSRSSGYQARECVSPGCTNKIPGARGGLWCPVHAEEDAAAQRAA